MKLAIQEYTDYHVELHIMHTRVLMSTPTFSPKNPLQEENREVSDMGG